MENGKMLWVPASAESIAGSKKGKTATKEELLVLIPIVDGISMDSLVIKAKTEIHLGRDCVRSFVNVLVEEGKVRVTEVDRPRTNPAKFYVRIA
jgi:hypothetical protein